jgi:hypothetical protein
MIHPNMYNDALKRAGIEGMTIKEDEHGKLQVEFDAENVGSLLAEFVNKIVEADIIYKMVLPSNVNKIKEVRRDLSDLLDLAHFDSDNRERSDANLEALDCVINNLKGLPNA